MASGMSKVTSPVIDAFATVGDFATFSARTFAVVPSTIRMYSKEILRQLKDVAWGSGALLVGGGTVGVMVLLSLAAGTSLGIEGFSGLELVSLAPLTGFISASANTRELAPLIAALALAARVEAAAVAAALGFAGGAIAALAAPWIYARRKFLS